MDKSFRLFPEQASRLAPEIDALYSFLWWLTGFCTIAIAVSIVFFAVRYRHTSRIDRGLHENARVRKTIEIAWIVIPLLISLMIFGWSAKIFFAQARPPAGALEIQVVGRQWMWKLQHPEGNAEINELHVPLGRAVRLNMISEDVIHSFFVPAFRVKYDVLPGRYTSIWFEPSKVGQYHLFCAEYCGAKHSRMVGRVVVMEPSDYQQWLAGGPRTAPPAELGGLLFEEMRCSNCHRGGGLDSRGPPIDNLYGNPVALNDGRSVIADEAYLRESILRPAAKVVAGFQPIMPPFEGQIGEEGLLNLIAYIKSRTAYVKTKPAQQ